MLGFHSTTLIPQQLFGVEFDVFSILSDFRLIPSYYLRNDDTNNSFRHDERAQSDQSGDLGLLDHRNCFDYLFAECGHQNI